MPEGQPHKRLISEATGVAEIGLARQDGTTRLAHLYQHDPLRVLFPVPEPADIPVAVLLTTSGGLVAGDRLAIDIRVEKGAAIKVGRPGPANKAVPAGRIGRIVSQRFTCNGGWRRWDGSTARSQR